MKFQNGLYICIYTVYMRFSDFVYIQYIYNLERYKTDIFQYFWLRLLQINNDFKICIYDIYNFCIYNVYICI